MIYAIYREEGERPERVIFCDSIELCEEHAEVGDRVFEVRDGFNKKHHRQIFKVLRKWAKEEKGLLIQDLDELE